MKGRVQKLIAASGHCSRRKAEEMIKEGRVEVNGREAVLGDTADTVSDEITIDGKAIQPEKKVYVILNKPAGYECTLASTTKKPLAIDLVDVPERIFPIGRLDADSRGLLLLTNDGDFTNALIHPSSGITKEYAVTVSGHVTDEDIKKLREGVLIERRLTRPCQVMLMKRGQSLTLLKMVLHEGRKRQIRRMLESLNFKVTDIVRERLGPLTIAGIREKSWRHLTKDEVKSLLEASRKRH